MEIAKAYDSDPSKYQKYWDVIDERWNSTLHSPLHAVGYFLNPAIRYRLDVSTHTEIRRGLQQAIGRIEPDLNVQFDAINQINDYVNATMNFGTEAAIRGRYKLGPVAWWQSFGTDHPDLQRIAVRILSQNCSSSGCERNWSTFDQIYMKKRNRLKQKKLNDLVYIHYNLRLREKQLRRHTSSYNPNELDNFLIDDEIDEWIRENEDEFDGEDLSWLDNDPEQSHLERRDELRLNERNMGIDDGVEEDGI